MLTEAALTDLEARGIRSVGRLVQRAKQEERAWVFLSPEEPAVFLGDVERWLDNKRHDNSTRLAAGAITVFLTLLFVTALMTAMR